MSAVLVASLEERMSFRASAVSPPFRFSSRCGEGGGLLEAVDESSAVLQVADAPAAVELVASAAAAAGVSVLREPISADDMETKNFRALTPICCEDS